VTKREIVAQTGIELVVCYKSQCVFVWLDWGLDNRGTQFKSRQGQSAVQWVPGFFPRGVMRRWYECDHSLLSSTTFRSERKCTETHPHACMDPGTRWFGGWLSPKAGLDAMLKRKLDQA